MADEDILHEAVIPPEASGQRLDKALAALIPALTRTRLKQLIQEGRVSLDEAAVTDPAAKVSAGQAVTVAEPAPLPAEPQAEGIPLKVVFEDDHLVVVDKPAGLVVHPAPGAETGTLVNALLHHCRGSLSGVGGVERPGIVHRIDKETSGLLVIAKSDEAHRGLAQQFEAHSIERAYLAFTRGCPRVRAGTIDKPIARSRHDRKKMAVAKTGGRRAVTRYRVIACYGKNAEKPVAGLLECRLETGRTHQIRVHLADLGYPVLGDPLYGRAKAVLPREAPEAVKEFVARAGRQALHAALLGFVHPVTGESLQFESGLPADLRALRESLESL